MRKSQLISMIQQAMYDHRIPVGIEISHADEADLLAELSDPKVTSLSDGKREAIEKVGLRRHLPSISNLPITYGCDETRIVCKPR